MWLLDPIYFTLREFMGEELPECAIVSLEEKRWHSKTSRTNSLNPKQGSPNLKHSVN